MLGMNRLPIAPRVQILSMLCEGSSMRSISCITRVSIDTVSKLLEDAEEFCAKFHDERVRGVKAKLERDRARDKISTITGERFDSEGGTKH